jgi:hypothetical protein
MKSIKERFSVYYIQLFFNIITNVSGRYNAGPVLHLLRIQSHRCLSTTMLVLYINTFKIYLLLP